MWLFRVFVSLLALTSLTVIPVLGQRNDGRIELNLGYLTSKSGRFASYGERCGTRLFSCRLLPGERSYARTHTRHLQLHVMYPRMYCIADVFTVIVQARSLMVARVVVCC